MISDFQAILDLCQELDAALKRRVRLYLIGGAMLLYHGLKPATKDIDAIVETREEFETLQRLLSTLGFRSKTPTVEYLRADLSQIFTREDFRIDLFERSVCKGFSLSAEMQARAISVQKFDHLEVLLCSHEDVLLFKSLTEREGDIEDGIALAQRGINWDAILEELKEQIKMTGKSVWITYVGERFDILQERGVVIPIMKEIDVLRDDYFDGLESKRK